MTLGNFINFMRILWLLYYVKMYFYFTFSINCIHISKDHLKKKNIFSILSFEINRYQSLYPQSVTRNVTSTFKCQVNTVNSWCVT